MKKLNIIALVMCLVVLYGCKPEVLNPGCPKIGYYFMGEVAGTNMCMRGGVGCDASSGCGRDNGLLVPQIRITTRTIEPFLGRVDIFCDIIPRSKYNMAYFRDTLFAVGTKKIKGTNMSGAGNFNVCIILPMEKYDDLTQKSYSTAYNDQTGSELRVTELKQMNDSLLLVTFLINCKLYDDDTDEYVGDLKNGEMRAGFVITKNLR